MALDRNICPVPVIDLTGPEPWKRAIREYDERTHDGEMRFDSEGFAIEPFTVDEAPFNAWLRNHLSIFDAPPLPERS